MTKRREHDETVADPLHLLPSEIVLHILDFATFPSIAALLRLNKDWKQFIEENEEHIYSAHSQEYERLYEEPRFTKNQNVFSTWKDICKRQTLLRKNWNDESLTTRESTIRVGDDPVWRFRPDFKRRFFISTSQGGGLFVTDFETGRQLWSLHASTVRAFAHLEYQDGTAVWDREGNALEVWRTDLPELSRGEFKLVAVLPHEKQTRGFQLSYDTLCVASSEGEGYVYDMRDKPTIRTKIDIEDKAVGHLDQGPDIVVCSIGKKGYHFHSKHTGERLGVISPKTCSNTYHIIHPPSKSDLHACDHIGPQNSYPPRHPTRERTVPIYIESGPYPPTRPDPVIKLADDEWGAGMLCDDLFVGISRSGRVLICPDWRKTLTSSSSSADPGISIVECDTDGSSFDLGGWLSIRDHRVMFEIQDRAYVVGLTDSNALSLNNTIRPSFAFSTSLAPQMATPVSFMALYDDCIMATYTTLRLRPRPAVGMPRAVPTKAIRVLSLAIDDDAGGEDLDRVNRDDDNRESHFRRMGIHPFVAAMMDPEELEEAESLAVEMDDANDDEETDLEALD